VEHGAVLTAVRFRRQAGKHWQAGRLVNVDRAAGGPGGIAVEVVDQRTGGRRALTTSRWQIEVDDAGRWLDFAAWADSTRPLFAEEVLPQCAVHTF
jgi:hypothetical protein